jgi:hypothetical protein
VSWMGGWVGGGCTGWETRISRIEPMCRCG